MRGSWKVHFVHRHLPIQLSVSLRKQIYVTVFVASRFKIATNSSTIRHCLYLYPVFKLKTKILFTNKLVVI